MQPHKHDTLLNSEQPSSVTPPHILVVDDEPEIRRLLKEILEDEGYVVNVAEHAQAAREAHRQRRPDLVLLDIWMPDIDGITLLKEWSDSDRGLPMPVIMMSGHGTVETAVEATRLGAYDFIEKPLSLAKLLLTVEHAIKNEQLRRENLQLRRLSHLPNEPIGRSPVMQRLREQIRRIAQHDTWVWLSGESGSGLNICAHYLHQCSPQRQRPFVEINVASLRSDTVLQDLFGIEAPDKVHYGLLEQANGGTLFLSDIGDMDMTTQAKLNSALETRRFQRIGGDTQVPLQVRVIAATHYNLEQAISAGRFRSDLYYQLNIVPIQVPPLRDHREDVPELLQYYISVFVDQGELPYRRFSLAAQNRLRNHSWPGNIRELSNLVQRLLIVGSGPEISLEEVEQALGQRSEVPFITPGMLPGFELPLREAREQYERAYLEHQLRLHGGKVGKIATIVGLERTHLYRKLRALGLDPKNIDDDE
ncbi:MAG: sigma-54-dependent Fis family transcriptional regulator [Gammaproteobacteria bacterium]|nr:sigma-54-dependent Fis family transcriptional regulator [Gammaproteobacteria bacterium]